MLGAFLFTSCNSSKEVTQTGTSKKETQRFVVYGQCGMCKDRIEGKLNYTKGVQYAEWNEKDKVLEVSFNPQKISLDEIKQHLAEVGHDSDTHRAADANYDQLHTCCKYERPEK